MFLQLSWKVRKSVFSPIPLLKGSAWDLRGTQAAHSKKTVSFFHCALAIESGQIVHHWILTADKPTLHPPRNRLSVQYQLQTPLKPISIPMQTFAWNNIFARHQLFPPALMSQIPTLLANLTTIWKHSIRLLYDGISTFNWCSRSPSHWWTIALGRVAMLVPCTRWLHQNWWVKKDDSMWGRLKLDVAGGLCPG